MPLLSAGLSERHLVLGGGSILQARWAHRTSTDLDFFVPEAALSGHPSMMQLRHDRMMSAASAMRRAGHRVDRSNAQGLHGQVSGVAFSVGVAHWMPVEFDRELMRGAEVQAASTEEIFYGKIHGRFRHGRRTDGAVPIRDLFDLTVCMREMPEILQHHFALLSDEQAITYAKRLNALPANWHELDAEAVIDPQYAVEMHGLPQLVAQAVLSRDATVIPVARPVLANDGDSSIGAGP